MKCNELMEARYSAAEAAYALEHGNFGDFHRNLRKADLTVLHRDASPGPGAEFRYAHLVELALHMHLGDVYHREVAKRIVQDLLDRLQENDTGLANWNAQPKAAKRASEAAWEQSDLGLPDFRFLEEPSLFLGEDLISRDLDRPTFALFHGTARARRGTLALVTGKTSLSEAHATFIERTTRWAKDNELRQKMEIDCHVPGIANLTSILVRLDRRLGHCIAARPDAATAKA